jgi:glycosyl transferase family 25
MIKTYIINLEKDKDRIKKITELLKDSKLNYIRFDAIYGKNIEENVIDNKFSYACKTFLCNNGIMGCALSHYTLWTTLLKEEDEYFLILEDDIEYINFNKLYNLINNLNKFDWDIINLHNIFPLNISSINKIDDIEIVNNAIPTTLCGYIINKNGLNKVIKYFKNNKINWHIDVNVSMLKYIDNLKFYSVKESIVKPSINDSSINSTDDNLSKIILKIFGLNKIAWYLSVPLLTIKRKYTISIYHIFWIIFFIFNIKYFQSILIYIYLFIDLILLYNKN